MFIRLSVVSLDDSQRCPETGCFHIWILAANGNIFWREWRCYEFRSTANFHARQKKTQTMVKRCLPGCDCSQWLVVNRATSDEHRERRRRAVG